MLRLSTIRDVAEAAGVSIATVSHVFNGTASISDKTRESVLRAAAELKYVPRSMRKKSRKRRVVVFKCFNLRRLGETDPHIHEEPSEGILVAVIRTLVEHQCDPWIIPYTEASLANGIDPDYLVGASGALVINTNTTTFSSFPEIPIPTVLAYCACRDNRYLSVVPDDFQGAYAATKHLIQLGYRRLAFINGPGEWLASRDRLNGYLAALHEAGMESDPALIANGNWSATSGRQLARTIRERTDFDALFAANDYMAYGALQYLREAGLVVPDDVALVGYDNRRISALADPPMTTVQLPLDAIGETATLELLKLMDRNKKEGARDGVASRVQIHSPLVIRDSCGFRLRQKEAANAGR